MISRQFSALETKLQLDEVLSWISLAPQTRVRTPDDRLEADIATWLRNGWSTERLLRQSENFFKGKDRSFALHWAFPQAYYTVFAVAIAFFKARGSNEQSHAAVIRRVGEDMAVDQYPKVMSFLAVGGLPEIQYVNVDKQPAHSTLAFDAFDESSVETQIAQFLCATRTRDLKAYKPKMKLQTKAGKPKKKFSRDDWDRTSKKLGPTSILSLLYRNRIKSNYVEIDTYLSDDLDTDTVFRSLVHVVHCLNLIHEAKLRDVVGSRVFGELLANAGGADRPFVADRQTLLNAHLVGS